MSANSTTLGIGDNTELHSGSVADEVGGSLGSRHVEFGAKPEIKNEDDDVIIEDASEVQRRAKHFAICTTKLDQAEDQSRKYTIAEEFDAEWELEVQKHHASLERLKQKVYESLQQEQEGMHGENGSLQNQLRETHQWFEQLNSVHESLDEAVILEREQCRVSAETPRTRLEHAHVLPARSVNDGDTEASLNADGTGSTPYDKNDEGVVTEKSGAYAHQRSLRRHQISAKQTSDTVLWLQAQLEHQLKRASDNKQDCQQWQSRSNELENECALLRKQLSDRSNVSAQAGLIDAGSERANLIDAVHSATRTQSESPAHSAHDSETANIVGLKQAFDKFTQSSQRLRSELKETKEAMQKQKQQSNDEIFKLKSELKELRAKYGEGESSDESSWFNLSSWACGR
eukprot:TRINITY_DN2764_c0_g2_i1.p1 TRINITY_DN2764_c0_g2~~TRINITY_DN2764_c0_g2_i1.p1  ORF type:complete len:401 (-),score=66.59 TRINITY_DN2764_c0_g2_i1:220-1422(-)